MTAENKNVKPGERIAIEITVEADPVTGRLVERLSPPGADMVLPYFTREIVTPDNKGVLVACNRTGEWLP